MLSSLQNLDSRRKSLNMPLEMLIQRSGVPRSAVVRILRCRVDSVRVGQFQNVADVLWMPFGAAPSDPKELRHREALKKASERAVRPLRIPVRSRAPEPRHAHAVPLTSTVSELACGSSPHHRPLTRVGLPCRFPGEDLHEARPAQ